MVNFDSGVVKREMAWVLDLRMQKVGSELGSICLKAEVVHRDGS